jgi:hypothetical protein
MTRDESLQIVEALLIETWASARRQAIALLLCGHPVEWMHLRA